MCHLKHRLRFFLFHRKTVFCSQVIQVFVFLTIPWFTKSVTSGWVLVRETRCIFEYSGTSLKRALTGQKFLSALERCLPWISLNWKVPKFKVRLFNAGPTLTRTPPYLTMGMWNGEKEEMFFVIYQFILHQRLK